MSFNAKPSAAETADSFEPTIILLRVGPVTRTRPSRCLQQTNAVVVEERAPGKIECPGEFGN
jgi:hypothetical protein